MYRVLQWVTALGDGVMYRVPQDDCARRGCDVQVVAGGQCAWSVCDVQSVTGGMALGEGVMYRVLKGVLC